MPTNIDSLQIEVSTSSEKASSGLDALERSLGKVRAATKGGLGLTSVAHSVSSLATAMDRLDSSKVSTLTSAITALQGLRNVQGIKVSSTIARSISDIGYAASNLNANGLALLSQIAPALSSLSTVRDVKLSSTIASQIREIAGATSAINASDLSKITEMANQIGSLANLSDIKISSTIANRIIDLGIAAQQLQGIDLSVFGNLAEAMHPLSGIEKVTNLTSALTQLGKIPELMQKLSSANIADFAARIRELADALEPLSSRMQSVAQGFSDFPQHIQQAIQSTQQLTNANRGATSSYVNLYAQLRMAAIAVKSAGTKVAGWINQMNEYIENTNLFTASMGEYAESAQAYAEKVGNAMGIDPSVWMRNQGVFMTLATGFGVAADRAAIMSQNMTQLGYDLSSFFNIKVDDAMQKLQSGLSGELEPLRRLGYDLSQARLKVVAAELGITKNFNDMTQAEKSQLRYYAIMTQVQTAQGDMARTLETPANQLRVFQAQCAQAARALGSIFIPVLNAVIPVAIAVAKAIRMVAAAIASLFGFALPAIDYSSVTAGMDAVGGGAADLDDNLKKAGGSAKKLKSYLMGFDELNVIDPNQNSGGGGGGGGGGKDSGGWNDFDLPVYDFLDGLISGKVDEIMASIQPYVDWIIEHLDGILAVAEAIGAAILGWKVAKALIPDLGLVRNDLSKLLSLTVAVGTIVISAILSYKFSNAYLQDKGIGNLIADGITAAAGAYISGKAVAHAFGTKYGYFTAGISLTLSAATTIKAVYDRTTADGWNARTIVSDVWAAIKGGVAGGLFAKAVGASIVAGVAVGAAIALTAGVVITLIAIEVHKSEQAKLDRVKWGKITLTKDQMAMVVGRLLSFDVTNTVKLIGTTIENQETAKNDLDTAMKTFQATLNKLEVGAEFSSADLESMKSQLTGENGLVDQMQTYLDQSKKTIELGISLVPPKTANGEDLSTHILNTIGLASEQLNGAVTDIGSQMATLLTKGMKEGLTDSEQEMIVELGNWLNEIEQAVTTGKIGGEFAGKTDILLSDLTRESFGSTLDAYIQQEDQLKQSYENLMIQQRANLEGYLGGLKITKQMYEAAGKSAEAEEVGKTIADLEAQLASWDPKVSVEVAMEPITAEARAKWLEAFKTIYADAIKSAGENGVLDAFVEQFSYGNIDFDKYGEQVGKDFANKLSESLRNSISAEDWAEVQKALDAGLFTIWDTYGTDAQSRFFNSFAAGFGTSNAEALLTNLGYDMTAMISEGIASGQQIIKNEAGDLVLTLKDGTKVAITKNNPALVKMFKSLGADLVNGTVVSMDSSMAGQAQKLAEIFGFPFKQAEAAVNGTTGQDFGSLGETAATDFANGIGTIVPKSKTKFDAVIASANTMTSGVKFTSTAMASDVNTAFTDAETSIKNTFLGLPNWFGTTVTNPSEGKFSTLATNIVSLFTGAKNDTQTTWEVTPNWFDTIVSSPIGVLFTALGTLITGMFGDSETSMETIWENVATWFETIVSSPVGTLFITLGAAIITALTGAKDDSESVWKPVSEWFGTIVSSPIGVLFTTLATTILTSFTGARDDSKTVWEKVSDWFGTIVSTPIGSLFVTLGTSILNAFTGARDDTKTAWGTKEVSDWFSKIVTSPVGTLFATLGSGILSAFTGAKDNSKTAWTGVDTWFGTNVKNPIVALFTSVVFKALGVDSATGLKEGLTSVEMPVLQPIVTLIKNGWETVTGWVNTLFGDTNNDTSISLVKSGWETVSKWVNGLFGDTANNESVGLLKSGWETVSKWVNAATGDDTVEKKVKLTKGSWITLPSDHTISITANLLKSTTKWFTPPSDSNITYTASLVKNTNKWATMPSSSSIKITASLVKSSTSWITLPGDKTITITAELKKKSGSKVTFSSSVKNGDITLAASGGMFDSGQMFIAREAGPELVGSIGSRSAVVNNSQIVESVSAGVYAAVSAAMAESNEGNGHVTINLDGKTIYENQQGIARNRGYDMGMGAFSFG